MTRAPVPLAGRELSRSARLLAGALCATLGGCSAGEKGATPRDTLAGSDAAAPTASIAQRSDSALGATVPDTVGMLMPGFYPIVPVQISSMSADTIIRQRMITPAGWVYAEQEYWSSNPTSPDLSIRADSSPHAQLVAYVDYTAVHDGGWDMVYAVRDSSLRGEMDCVRSEVFGIAAVKVVGSWAQVAYGYTSSGDARLGWIKLVPGKVVFTNEQEPLDE